jgi:hypothetical protein
MTGTHRIRPLVATLREALHEIESALGLTREEVDAIGQEAVRLREDTAVGIDMVIDAAMALLQAFQDLELVLPDAQADLETLEAEREDEDAGDVCAGASLSACQRRLREEQSP